MKPILAYLVLMLGSSLTLVCDAFIRGSSTTKGRCTQLGMGKRKPSMKEKRQQRRAKQLGQNFQNPYANLPKAKLQVQELKATKALDTPEKFSNPAEAATKAQDLLKAQRESVDMLTKVRERVEALPSELIMTAMNSQGYFVVDDFLCDKETISQLEAEALELYAGGELEVDMTNLGSGEYMVAIKGGKEQYTKCPRLVEWTVSTTKHLPEQVTEPALDPGACMATLRAFDRKAFQASLNLLTGSDKVPKISKPFETIVTDSSEDKRRLSLQYFLVPENWDGSCGGSLSFESGETVMGKRDRMVLWKSDSTRMRKDPWEGNNNASFASCLELHLVDKLT